MVPTWPQVSQPIPIGNRLSEEKRLVDPLVRRLEKFKNQWTFMRNELDRSTEEKNPRRVMMLRWKYTYLTLKQFSQPLQPTTHSQETEPALFIPTVKKKVMMSSAHPLQILSQVSEEFESPVEDVLLLLGQVVHFIPL